MRSFTVTPENLRRTASVVDASVHSVETETAVADARRLGHTALTTAVSDLMRAMTGGWAEATVQTDDLASGLRDSADAYERAEAEADATLASRLPDDPSAAAPGGLRSFTTGWSVFITDVRHQGPAPSTRTEAQRYTSMIATSCGDEVPRWGNPDERDNHRLSEADRERYG